MVVRSENVRRVVTIPKEVYRQARILAAIQGVEGGFSGLVKDLIIREIRGNPDLRKLSVVVSR